VQLESDKKLDSKTIEKINLYTAAMYLYSKGKSHPQIIKILSEHSYNSLLVQQAVDKARTDEWDKLYEEARKLFTDGKTYDEVVKEIKLHEEDKDIVNFVVNRWYEYKTIKMSDIIDSKTNIMEGSLWAVISGIVLIIVFLLGLGIISKIIWSLVFIGSLFQWLSRFLQKNISNKLQLLFEYEKEA
jgi:hypothetical protein